MATLTDAFLADLDDLSDGDNDIEEPKEEDIKDEVPFVLLWVGNKTHQRRIHCLLLGTVACMSRNTFFFVSKLACSGDIAHSS
jgi:hypothetical protein